MGGHEVRVEAHRPHQVVKGRFAIALLIQHIAHQVLNLSTLWVYSHRFAQVLGGLRVVILHQVNVGNDDVEIAVVGVCPQPLVEVGEGLLVVLLLNVERAQGLVHLGIARGQAG